MMTSDSIFEIVMVALDIHSEVLQLFSTLYNNTVAFLRLICYNKAIQLQRRAFL